MSFFSAVSLSPTNKATTSIRRTAREPCRHRLRPTHRASVALQAGGSLLQRLGNRESLVAPLAGCRGGGAQPVLFARSLEPSPPLAATARPPELAEAISGCRRKTGWGPRLVAGATGFCHQTVWKVPNRAGISQPPPSDTRPANRYEWPSRRLVAHGDKQDSQRPI